MSRATQDTPGSLTISHTGLSPSVAGLPRPFCYRLGIPLWGPTTPKTLARSRFGLFPVRSPLLRESRLISLPPGTEMFHFPGLAPFRVMGHDSHWVSPFGHPRIKACFLLPAAFRRLLRPSSPLCAKASTVCPLQLAVLLFVQRCLSYSAVSMMLPSYFQPSSYIACSSSTLVSILLTRSCSLFLLLLLHYHPRCSLPCNVDCSFLEFNLFCFQRTLELDAHKRQMPLCYRLLRGPIRDRTVDLLNANQALSQLSYGPINNFNVGRSGLEPPASRLSGVCSNQLSYRPICIHLMEFGSKEHHRCSLTTGSLQY